MDASRPSWDDRVRFFIGDVRASERLTLASRGVDVVVHAAALKQVPACEYNPFEAVQTNIVGAENVVAAAIANDVAKRHRAQHRQGREPGEPLRSHEARRREDLDPGQRLCRAPPARFASVRYGNVVGQPRQRHPALQATGQGRAS